MDHFRTTSFGVVRYSYQIQQTTKFYFFPFCVVDVDKTLPFFAGAVLCGGVLLSIHPQLYVAFWVFGRGISRGHFRTTLL